jgi:hypothetical protein
VENGFGGLFVRNAGCSFGINDVEMLRTVYPEKHFCFSFLNKYDTFIKIQGIVMHVFYLIYRVNS